MWWACLIINYHGSAVAGMATRGVAMAVPKCVLCDVVLPNCRERRVLYSKESCHVVSTAIELLQECVLTCSRDESEIEIEGLLRPSDGSHSYICRRPCFSTLERIQKLARELDELREGVKGRLRPLYRGQLRKRATEGSEEQAASTVHIAEAMPRAKKRLVFTDPVSSPVVTVS